jgi:hypothetical protein
MGSFTHMLSWFVGQTRLPKFASRAMLRPPSLITTSPATPMGSAAVAAPPCGALGHITRPTSPIYNERSPAVAVVMHQGRRLEASYVGHCYRNYITPGQPADIPSAPPLGTCIFDRGRSIFDKALAARMTPPTYPWRDATLKVRGSLHARFKRAEDGSWFACDDRVQSATGRHMAGGSSSTDGADHRRRNRR